MVDVKWDEAGPLIAFSPAADATLSVVRFHEVTTNMNRWQVKTCRSAIDLSREPFLNISLVLELDVTANGAVIRRVPLGVVSATRSLT